MTKQSMMIVNLAKIYGWPGTPGEFKAYMVGYHSYLSMDLKSSLSMLIWYKNQTKKLGKSSGNFNYRNNPSDFSKFCKDIWPTGELGRRKLHFKGILTASVFVVSFR